MFSGGVEKTPALGEGIEFQASRASGFSRLQISFWFKRAHDLLRYMHCGTCATDANVLAGSAEIGFEEAGMNKCQTVTSSSGSRDQIHPALDAGIQDHGVTLSTRDVKTVKDAFVSGRRSKRVLDPTPNRRLSRCLFEWKLLHLVRSGLHQLQNNKDCCESKSVSCVQTNNNNSAN
jgi:hypothetical protein